MSKKNFLGIALIMGCYATAQTTTDSLQNVTVTTTKVEQKQNSTGKVITVIGKEVLEKSTGKTVSQLLNEQAGITIAGAYNALGTPQSVYMRGANSGRTLILMDGVPMNDPSQINNEFDLNLFNLNDIERIEVCRGAESTLYGSDAVAGVINIITIKKDVKKPFNAKYTFTAGSLNTFKNNIQFFGKQNKFSYQVRAAKLNSDGFSSAYDSTGNKGFDKDKFNGGVVNAAVQYQATNALDLRSFLQYSSYEAGVDAAIFKDDKDFTVNNNNLSTGFGVDYKTDKIKLIANYVYSQNNRKFIDDSTDIPTNSFSKFVSNIFFSKSQFAELYASINLGSGFTLLQGADFRQSNMNNQYLSISNFGFPPYPSKFPDTAMSNGSMYSSIFYNSKHFNFEIGGRLNVNSRYGSNYTYTINPSYKFDEKWRTFASISSGFKAPTLYQLFDGFVGNENLQPEKSINYEAGIAYNSKKLNTRVVYFKRDIQNGIDYNNISFKYFNINKQIVSGIEFELNYSLNEKLSINSNYTYLNATENSQSRVNFKDTVYNNLLRRPNNNLNFSIGYKPWNNLFISVTGKNVGQRFDVGGYKKQDVLLPSYFIMSAYAEYSFMDKAKLFVDVQNIFNKKFFDIRGYNAIPTLLTVGATLNF
jgi:vitamin B12 transporter